MMSSPAPRLPVRPVRRAYEQVAAQIRDLVLSGQLTSGDRLPTEGELCERFGVSRSTVREALRTLASDGIVVTQRGANGGTFIAAPGADRIMDYLTGTLSLMAGSEEVSVAELLEARELLEVPAARKAAVRRTDDLVARLEANVAAMRHSHRDQSFGVNRTFHEIVLEASDNRLLRVMTQPLFSTLQSRFLRDQTSEEFWTQVIDDHERITRAIDAGDADAAARAMVDHLAALRPTYERIDTSAPLDTPESGPRHASA